MATEIEKKVTALKEAIKEGFDSGRSANFNPQELLANLKAKRKAKE